MKLNLRLTILGLLLSLAPNVQAQQVRPAASGDIYKQLQQLQRMGTVMYIAAHPDDENTRLITYLVHHDHINTIYLSLTRGDGGQNIIGNEQGAALGLIRTNEMMMARKLDGGKQLFTRFIDFGFTKSPEETFKFWDKQKVVDDIKLAIQQHRPDVLICRFPTTGEGGHGQHTASAIAALEAFEQLQNDNNPNTWKPKRILFNAFSFGSANTIKPGQFQLAINHYDPILGASYGEIAGKSRSEHKSQGAGTPQTYGISKEHFELMAGAAMNTSIYDGIDTSWGRIGQAKIGKKIAALLSKFDFNAPQKSLPALLKLKSDLKKIKVADSYWLKEKMAQLDQIIIQCTGLQLEALAPAATAVFHQELNIKLNALARAEGIKILKLTDIDKHVLLSELPLSTDTLRSFETKIQVAPAYGLTQPYWLAEPSRGHQFAYPAPYTNEPLSRNTFALEAQVQVGKDTITIALPISYKRLDPTRGDVIEAVRIVPAVDIAPVQSSIMRVPGKDLQADAYVHSRAALKNAALEIVSEDGEIISTVSGLSFKSGERKKISISIADTTWQTQSNPAKIYYRVKTDKGYFEQQMHLIEYPHIPTLQYFSPASAHIITQQWKNHVKNVGYIAGAGDKVAESMQALGINVTQLSPTDLSDAATLKQYDAIVCGVRMANTRKDVAKYLPELWKYIEQGGTVLMQYNTSMALEIEQFAPLPIKLSRDRVTNEQAPVSIIDEKASILLQPNKIATEDFANWVQERGVYYPAEWHPSYKTAIAMNDPGEPALKSAVLYAQYGKGYFVYTPLAFFRQLPAGNIGAIRLFLNLLNVGK